jgi:cysteine desulfurase
MVDLRSVYLDYAATTPLDPLVLDSMMPFLTREFGNAASPHPFGRRALAAVEEARAQVAALINADPEEIVFTSGATESINLALKGIVSAAPVGRRHLVTTPTEHKAVLDSADALEVSGARVTVVPVDRHGVVELDALERALTRDTCLVSVMAANNETGTLGPVQEIAALARERGALVHTDATQFAGKLPLDVDELGVDLLSLSSHKLYGPKGVGALYVRRGRRSGLAPLIHGGGHEGGLRSGTLNVPGCVGFGRACQVAEIHLGRDADALRTLRDELERTLLARVQETSVNGHIQSRLPNIANLRFAGVDSDSLMLAMPDVAVSSGSACTSATPAPSHVLRAMGIGYAAAGESIRFSLGRPTTLAEIDYAATRVSEVVEMLRRDSHSDLVGAST